MNVRTKILLLLLVIVLAFTLGLLAIQRKDDREFRAILDKRETERKSAFDQFSKHWGESLETFVSYVSCWDELVSAIARDDLHWGETNLSDNALTSYRSQAAWIYRSDATLFYTRNVLYSDALPDVPIAAEELVKWIEGKQMSHFYAWTKLGLMEFRGASIHPSRDTERTSAAVGYFFAGRVWTVADLNEVALFTGNQIELLKPGKDGTLQGGDPDSGTVRFARALAGPSGTPVAWLRITNESPVIAQMRRSKVRELQWLIVFALVVFLIMSISLLRWLTIPLRALARALRSQSAEHLTGLQQARGEFGDFARLIVSFFVQQKELVRETEDRRLVQEALTTSEEQLRHSQKMDAIGQLAGGIAHDFNNLLTAIIGYSEMLVARLTGDSEARQQSEVVLKAGKQAAALTRQLLAFSRKQLLQPRVVDLNELIRGLEQLLQRLLGETIQLRVEPNANPALVLADPTQLEQVVINLGVNARDAMPRGGVLTISTANRDSAGANGVNDLPGRSICLSVCDTGIGMDARTCEKVFEPFFTTKEIGKGTGLGLATVYGIVQQSGGSIWLESELGRGTTFYFSLPEAVGEVEKTPLSEPKAVVPFATETLLVVEDEQIVRDFVCAALDEEGYQVLVAADGAAGLEIALQHPGEIHLLITDVIMPGMNGPELARQLSALRPAIQVLFVSGYSDNDLARHGNLSSEINFLEKPFSPAALHEKIREVLHGKSALLPLAG